MPTRFHPWRRSARTPATTVLTAVVLGLAMLGGATGLVLDGAHPGATAFLPRAGKLTP